MRNIIVLGLVAVTLAGCARIQGGLGALGVGQASAKRADVQISGVRFRARANADGADRRQFTVTVTPFAADPDGAREAGRYQATRYCLLTYGGSDTEWTAGPDLPAEALTVEGDTLLLQGRCTQR